MLRPVIAVLCVGLFVGVSCRAASAAVAATWAITGPQIGNTFTGPCPVNIQFAGTITAPAGTPVTYIFSHFVNGASVVSAPIKATIPAGGSLAIGETLPIDQAHSGFQSNEVDVQKPSAAQGKVFFTVTCSTITPVPSGVFNNHPNIHMYTVVPPSPIHLTNTTNAQVCGSHGGFAALFCPDALHNGYLVLVWDWIANSKWPSANGFRVYEVDGGQHKLVDTQLNGQLTISFQKPVAGGFGGKCYAVTAYVGKIESFPSAKFCLGGVYTSRQSKTLHTFHWAYHYYSYSGSGALGGLAVQGLKCTDLCMGWVHSISGGGLTLNHANAYWRSYVQFDPSQIAGLNVYKAFLKLTLVSGKPECFGAVGAADGQSWDTDNMPSAPWEPATGSINNSGAELDVTEIVRNWAQGSPNWGFAFKGTNEDTGAEENASCTVDFATDAVLSIEYY